MASLQKYKTKNGQTRYRVMWRDAGRQKSKSFDKYVLAKDYQISVENGLRSGTYIAPSKTTVSQYLDGWLDIHKQRIEYNTFIGYRINVNHIKEHIGDIPLQELSGDHIELMYKDLSKSLKSKSIHYIHQTLNTALKAAIRKRIININPCNTIEPPRKGPKYEPNVIEPHMVSEYLGLFKGTWIYIALIVSTVCGLRRGELSALQWPTINLITGEMQIVKSSYIQDNKIKEKLPKSNNVRKVYLPPSLIILFKEHKKWQQKNKLRLGTQYHNSNYIITYEDGRRPQPARLTQFFKRRLIRSNLEYVRLQDLRGTMASLTCFEGYGDDVASAALGHHDPKFTRKHYIQKYEQELINTANALDKYIVDLL